MTTHDSDYDLDREIAEHARLGGMTITPRYGTTEEERAELRAQGYTLSDEQEGIAR